MTNFTEVDLKKHEELSNLLLKQARWAEADTSTMVHVFHCLAWFDGLKQKIKDHQLEVSAVKQIAKAEEVDAEAAVNSTATKKVRK